MQGNAMVRQCSFTFWPSNGLVAFGTPGHITAMVQQSLAAHIFAKRWYSFVVYIKRFVLFGKGTVWQHIAEA